MTLLLAVPAADALQVQVNYINPVAGFSETGAISTTPTTYNFLGGTLHAAVTDTTISVTEAPEIAFYINPSFHGYSVEYFDGLPNSLTLFTDVVGFTQDRVSFVSDTVFLDFAGLVHGTETSQLTIRSEVAPVPGPMVGAGLPGLAMAVGALLAWRRRKQNQRAA
jgi:hypothetical protein